MDGEVVECLIIPQSQNPGKEIGIMFDPSICKRDPKYYYTHYIDCGYIDPEKKMKKECDKTRLKIRWIGTKECVDLFDVDVKYPNGIGMHMVVTFFI